MHERYLAGDRTRIWHELRQLGDRVQEPGLYADAQAVCDEMARRARYNIETLVSRLEGHGYVFHSNDERRNRVRPFYPATERGGLALAWLGERIGPAPLALSSWLRLVGDVWLVGTHPQWSDSASADPLVIEVEGSSVPDTSVEQYLEEEYQGWAELSEDNPGEAVSFELPLAPDSLTKADVSGGIYRMPLPDRRRSRNTFCVLPELGLPKRRVPGTGGRRRPVGHQARLGYWDAGALAAPTKRSSIFRQCGGWPLGGLVRTWRSTDGQRGPPGSG